MKKLLILSLSPLDRDPRVDRQIRTLNREYDLTISGLTPPVGLESIPFVSLNKRDYVKPTCCAGNIAGLQPLGKNSISMNAKHSSLLAMKAWLHRYIPFLVPPAKVFKRYIHMSIRFIRDGLGRGMRVIRRGGYARSTAVGRPWRNYKPSKLEWYESFHFDLARDRILALGPYDAILANDLTGLVLVRRWGLEATLIYDAHEYSPGQYAPDALGREKAEQAYRFLRGNLKFCDAVMTVCEGIAEEYAREFGIEKPVVVTNATRYRDLTPAICTNDSIRLVHHGVAAAQRKIENMIDAIILADSRYELDLYLIHKDAAYYECLKARASACPRIRFLEPMPMQEIAERLNVYDAGFYILEPINFNHLHALPNKLFEFIQARIGIIIGPSPEIARYVTTYQLGAVADDFSPQAMARLLAGISRADINRFKEHAHRHAFELSGEVQASIISDLVRETIHRSRSVEGSPVREGAGSVRTVS